MRRNKGGIKRDHSATVMRLRNKKKVKVKVKIASRILVITKGTGDRHVTEDRTLALAPITRLTESEVEPLLT